MAKPDIDLPRLHQAMTNSLRSMEVYRTNFVAHVKEYVGAHWNQDSDAAVRENHNPANMLSLYLAIMHRELVGSDPRMNISTFDRKLRPIVTAMQEWGNRRLSKLKFRDVLSKAVMDSLFLIGIVKTSLTSPVEARFGGYTRSVAEPGLFNVLYEDFVFDSRANSFDECDFMGHIYTAYEDDVQKSKLFKKKPRKEVVAQDDEMYDFSGNEKLSSLGKTITSNGSDYLPKVRLWEVYLPRDGVVVTFDADGDMDDDPLLVQNWVGPPCGPFAFLQMGDVPGNIMPKAPVMDLIDLHREFNMVWKKLGNQTFRQKTNITYRDDSDQKAHEQAKDGDYIKAQDPDGMKEVSSGGPNNLVQMRSIEIQRVFNKLAGNIDSIGGLATQSDTATQDKLIASSSSKQVDSMAHRTAMFAQEVMRNLSWYFWHDPRMEMTNTYQVPGISNVQADVRITASQRSQHKFEDMDIRIDPYSLQFISPQQELTIINQVTKELIIPLLPMFRQPGVGEFLQNLIKMIAKKANCPDLEELLESLIGTQGPVEAETNESEAPTETTRTYERISKPGSTDNGQAQVMEQLLAGGNPQGQGMNQMAMQMR